MFLRRGLWHALKERTPNKLSTGRLKREAHLRESMERVEAWERGQFVVMDESSGRFVFNKEGMPAFLHYNELGGVFGSPVFLGTLDDVPTFAVRASGLNNGEKVHVPEEDRRPFDADGTLELKSFRNCLMSLDDDAANVVAFAQGVLNWMKSSSFCSNCGSAGMESRQGGNALMCVDCHRATFPRTDPAVIMLVTDHDNEQCILGRQAAWAPGRFSTLAGFVETGESLEDAVRREVLEEVGVHVDNVVYHSSQPWPFPQSLMLGFTARADVNQEVRPNTEEIEDAKWLTRDEISSGKVHLPPSSSISYRLIQDWMSSKQ